MTTTAKELHAAATTIVNGYLEVCRVMTPHVDANEQLASSTDKAVMLARHVLATVQPDDDEPVTEGWASAHGARRKPLSKRLAYEWPTCCVTFWPQCGDLSPAIGIGNRVLRLNPNVGQVRRLLAVLGVP